MRFDKIENQVASQHSFRQVFSSQGPSVDQMYSGSNQVAALEIQLVFAKLLADQR